MDKYLNSLKRIIETGEKIETALINYNPVTFFFTVTYNNLLTFVQATLILAAIVAKDFDDEDVQAFRKRILARIKEEENGH